MLVEQPLTGQRAFVQVKSSATPAMLDDYIARFASWPDCDRLVFVCHSPTPALAARAATANVELWFADKIASKVMQAGILDRLIKRAR